jgi:hypothetical protein
MAGIKAKVAVAKVIARLEARLEQNEADKKQGEINEQEWREALKKWQQDFVKNHAKVLVVDSINCRSYNNTIEIRYELPVGLQLPEEPKREYVSTLGGYEVQEIENAINILKMTDDEFVSASTFSSISKYL